MLCQKNCKEMPREHLNIVHHIRKESANRRRRFKFSPRNKCTDVEGAVLITGVHIMNRKQHYIPHDPTSKT